MVIQTETNAQRDVIVLALRAFRQAALESIDVQDAVHKGSSPMLTAHTVERKSNSIATEFHVPWERRSMIDTRNLLSDVDTLIDHGLSHHSHDAKGPVAASSIVDLEDRLRREQQHSSACKMELESRIHELEVQIDYYKAQQASATPRSELYFDETVQL